ncbi:dynein heavy chain axonemal [Lasius niger]|uniref:Dynein heavy chain axonemal n=1 Tax=Lasius niger TaxID=67767 RepID=A0A0J7K3Z4_LASNI|nr:dynein heavy chain axonemal [Lasius niger]
MTGEIEGLGQEPGVSATEDPPNGNVEEPIAGTSRGNSENSSRVNRPLRYRSVSKEVGTGPEGEILMRRVLEAIGESDGSEGKAGHHPEERIR